MATLAVPNQHNILDLQNLILVKIYPMQHADRPILKILVPFLLTFFLQFSSVSQGTIVHLERNDEGIFEWKTNAQD